VLKRFNARPNFTSILEITDYTHNTVIVFAASNPTICIRGVGSDDFTMQRVMKPIEVSDTHPSTVGQKSHFERYLRV